MKYIIRDREAGNVIDRFGTLEEAQAELARYEAEDRAEGTYEEDFYEIITEPMTIKEAREAAGLTRPHMAELFRIPYRTLQNWELNERQCPEWAELLIVEKLQRMADNN